MIFLNICNDGKDIEVFQHSFDVKDAQSIQLVIMDGCFEHAPIILRDPDGRVRGLFTLKTRIKTHYIGETKAHTSNGGISGELPNGTWMVEVLKPSLRVTGRIQLEIRQDQQLTKLNADDYLEVLAQDFDKVSVAQQPKWLRAELHTHSYYSDGRVNFEDIQEEIRLKQLDVVAMMDHSVVTTQFLKGDNLLIPGTEITLDNEVHYNVYGLKESIGYTDYFNEEKSKNQSLDDLFEGLKAKGYLLSINHPFADGMSLQHDFDIRRFNFVEVINAPYSVDDFIDNEKAIRFFDYLWSEGHLVFGIGGSDAHKKNYHERYPIGIPTNRIYCEAPSINNVLTSMANGSVYLEYECPCEVFIQNAQGEDILPGSEQTGELTFKAQSADVVTWQLVKDGQVIANQEGHSCEFKAELPENSYLRLEAMKDNQHVLFVNPIHNQLNRKQTVTSFAELIRQFELKDKS